MKYKDIDIKLARKCCKQHSYKSKKGMTIQKCENCPLERPKKMCWFMLKSLHENYANMETPLIKAEYDALMEETIEKQLDWNNWIEAQETIE